MTATTLDGVLLKGVAASRPAASAVAKGTLYSATDTGAITQSDGVSTWSAYATITQGNLTGDVTSVGLATTIGAGKVTEAMQVLADNTTQNVSTSKHGYAPKAPNDATKYLDGSGAYSTPAGGTAGALVFLEAHTASSSATLDFTTFISSTYDDYLIEIVGIIPATDATDLQLHVGTGGGPTYDSTASHYSSQLWGISNAGATVGPTVQNTGIPIIGRQVSNVVDYGGVEMTLRLQLAQSTVSRRNFAGQGQYVANPGSLAVHVVNVGAQFVTLGTALTALRFFYSSGNIASGTIRIYGVSKS